MSVAAQLPAQHPDLTVRQCETRAQAFRDARSHIVGVIAYCSETTKEYWAERARDLEANAEYWECRLKDRGRRS